MAVSFGFPIKTAMRVLIILYVSKETIQASKVWRTADNKEYFGQSSHKVEAGADQLHSRATVLKHRLKREVFGKDDRFVVPKNFTERCPFAAAVMISTGCSGVLVSPRHVLTSAHCLHNGSHYVDGIRNVKVGFLLRNGATDWQSISSTKMPRQWKTGQDLWAIMHDYALIKLATNHSRCYLPIAPSKTFYYKTACAHKAIHFTAFDDDRKEGTMLYRTCRVSDMNSNLLFHCCDAREGSSGAGVYEIRRTHGTKPKIERYVIGLFSGNRDIRRTRYPTATCTPGVPFFRWPGYYQLNYNAVFRLKESDVFHICTWMKRLGGDPCRKIIRERRRQRRQSRKRRERSRDARCEGVL